MVLLYNVALNIDLSIIDSIDAFFDLTGTNMCDWIGGRDGERETIDLGAFTPDSVRSIIERQSEQCVERTGWEWIICENMPESRVKWTLFGIMLTYYAPTLLNRWLLECAKLVHTDREVWRIVKSGNAKAKRRALSASIDPEWRGAEQLCHRPSEKQIGTTISLIVEQTIHIAADIAKLSLKHCHISLFYPQPGDRVDLETMDMIENRPSSLGPWELDDGRTDDLNRPAPTPSEVMGLGGRYPYTVRFAETFGVTAGARQMIIKATVWSMDSKDPNATA
ncbi:hypothetical protein DL762_001591 [Monosporascus cannonballus]|uniref:Uncharacterized protein n=1 Tax=Monosporascus cannonballus TaxID=155416 RepID=A0ABY0HJ11_9PEZI|nr:hypothetical protein DL762_001591 [Monosporascus cannonballus]